MKVGDLVLRDGIRRNPTDEYKAWITQGTLVSKVVTEAEELAVVAPCWEMRRQHHYAMSRVFLEQAQSTVLFVFLFFKQTL